jgi:hypothetical protein
MSASAKAASHHLQGRFMPAAPGCNGSDGAEARPGDRAVPTTDLLLKVRCVMSSSAVIPRGNRLTPVVELTGPDGVQWVGYIEGVPPVRRWRLLRQTVLPGRRMRFDSADESRLSPTVPVGAPFLPQRRLLGLLAESTPLPQPQPAPPTAAVLLQRRWERLRATGRTCWAMVRHSAARVSRTALRWVLSGGLRHAGQGMMVRRR